MGESESLMSGGSKTILITGGAGFIGRHLCVRLIKDGHRIRIIDNFNRQIHDNESLPEFIKNNVDLFQGDIRDKDLLKKALNNVQQVVHFASETGTGQSMYEVEKYFSTNVLGTAILLDLIQNDECGNRIESLVVASSRSIYGEGLYACKEHGHIYPLGRNHKDFLDGNFDPKCPHCGNNLKSLATTEDATLNPLSFYAITKLAQEQSILLAAKNKEINGFALRYQNVYGPGQSLKNPYTGILAIFSTLARQHLPINIFEDGVESRDFVYIDDVVEATVKCLSHNGSYIGPFNVGFGSAESVLSVANKIKGFHGSKSQINLTGDYRKGDIRHNYADIRLLKKIIGFAPQVPFEKGINFFLNWSKNEPIYNIKYSQSIQELKNSNMFIHGKPKN